MISWHLQTTGEEKRKSHTHTYTHTNIHTHTHTPVRKIVDPHIEVVVSANIVMQPSKIHEILSTQLFHLPQKEARDVQPI